VLQRNPDLRRATAYISRTETVKVSRRRKLDRRYRQEEFVVTLGTPNYRERQWIKDAQKASVSFPVRKIQLTYWPKKRKA